MENVFLFLEWNVVSLLKKLQEGNDIQGVGNVVGNRCSQHNKLTMLFVNYILATKQKNLLHVYTFLLFFWCSNYIAELRL
jgi:hypothetical protein